MSRSYSWTFSLCLCFPVPPCENPDAEEREGTAAPQRKGAEGWKTQRKWESERAFPPLEKRGVPTMQMKECEQLKKTLNWFSLQTLSSGIDSWSAEEQLEVTVWWSSSGCAAPGCSCPGRTELIAQTLPKPSSIPLQSESVHRSGSMFQPPLPKRNIPPRSPDFLTFSLPTSRAGF